jgi:hypothetical protein
MNKELAQSIAAFQQEVPAIMKSTAGYGYKYADWPAILEVINPLLKKHNLGFSQLVGSYELTTILFHIETGQTLESTMDIPQGVILKGMNEFQVLGSAITYCKRYQLSAILGLVSETDTDAAGEQVKPGKPKINAERFAAALKSINEGKYEVKTLKATFALTNEQLKQLPND